MLDYKTWLKHAEQIHVEEDIDPYTRREPLKRQYLRYYKMEKIIKEQNKREKVSAIKRQIMRMIARD